MNLPLAGWGAGSAFCLLTKTVRRTRNAWWRASGLKTLKNAKKDKELHRQFFVLNGLRYLIRSLGLGTAKGAYCSPGGLL